MGADDQGDIFGGLTAQLSTATLGELAERDYLNAREQPAVWSLPLLVLELGLRSS